MTTCAIFRKKKKNFDCYKRRGKNPQEFLKNNYYGHVTIFLLSTETDFCFFFVSEKSDKREDKMTTLLTNINIT